MKFGVRKTCIFLSILITIIVLFVAVAVAVPTAGNKKKAGEGCLTLADCDNGLECKTNICVPKSAAAANRVAPAPPTAPAGQCQSDANCVQDKWCDTTTLHICLNKLPGGNGCNFAKQCLSGACTNNRCSDAPASQGTKKAKNEQCRRNAECASGRCHLSGAPIGKCVAAPVIQPKKEDDLCPPSTTCPTGLVCRRLLNLQTKKFYGEKKCKPPIAGAGNCEENSYCRSGICTNNVCKTELKLTPSQKKFNLGWKCTPTEAEKRASPYHTAIFVQESAATEGSMSEGFFYKSGSSSPAVKLDYKYELIPGTTTFGRWFTKKIKVGDKTRECDYTIKTNDLMYSCVYRSKSHNLFDQSTVEYQSWAFSNCVGCGNDPNKKDSYCFKDLKLK